MDLASGDGSGAPGLSGYTTLGTFAALCEQLAATTRKLEKRALIAEWLRAQTPVDAGRGALYLAGTPFPETDGRKLNIGGALLSRALSGSRRRIRSDL